MFKKFKSKISALKKNSKVVVLSKKAEGYVDSGVKILIAIVVGALLLTLLYSLFNTTVFPTLTTKITELFGYSGS